jgi:hypothetical protein
MKLLCEIEDVFDIKGRGCVVVPGVPYAIFIFRVRRHTPGWLCPGGIR